ncbi:MAG: Gmad2 immunoglobulin-like domain-containing protein [Syntrophomonas sp.]|nr:Gmad2 immunoglobulin-like domain-containing protein [Syntrophomonas sp.]
MKLLRNSTVLVLLLGLVLLSAGCGSRTSQAPIPGQTNEETPTPSTSVPQTTDITVYYLKGTDKESYLVREVHQVEKTQAVAQAAVNELIKGNPVTPGAYRVLSQDTKVLGINIDQGLATVNFSSEVLGVNVGSAGEALGIASIVNTLTEFPTIQKVSFMVDGQVEKAIDWWGHVGLSEQPFSRNLTVVNEPLIWVTAPLAGQIITSTVDIKGNARVFEATVSFRLRDANGSVLAQGFANASEGAPGRGEFQGNLDFKPTGPGKGQIEVFEVSMKDGSDRNKVIIPVEWQ